MKGLYSTTCTWHTWQWIMKNRRLSSFNQRSIGPNLLDYEKKNQIYINKTNTRMCGGQQIKRNFTLQSSEICQTAPNNHFFFFFIHISFEKKPENICYTIAIDSLLSYQHRSSHLHSRILRSTASVCELLCVCLFKPNYIVKSNVIFFCFHHEIEICISNIVFKTKDIK